MGGDNGRKEGRVFKNNYKKPRGRVEAGEGDGVAGLGGKADNCTSTTIK